MHHTSSTVQIGSGFQRESARAPGRPGPAARLCRSWPPRPTSWRAGFSGVGWGLLIAWVFATGLQGDGVDALLGQLKGGSIEQRRLAARQLGESGSPEAVAPLIDCLAASDPILPSVAATALTKLGPLAVEGLKTALEHKDPQIRGWAAEVLARCGKQVVPELIAMLDSPSPGARKSSIQALLELKASQAIPALRAREKDPNRQVRQAASAALNQLGYQPASPEETVTHLIALERWDEVRKLGSPAAGALIAALKYEGVEGSVAMSLASIRAEEALGPLADCFQASGDEWVARALATFRPKGVEYLLAGLEFTNPPIRIGACYGLTSALNDPRVMRAMTTCLRTDRSDTVREAAADALGQVQRTTDSEALALKALIDSLKEDPSARVRKRAAARLGAFGNLESAQALVRATADPVGAVQGESWSALEQSLRAIGTNSVDSVAWFLAHPEPKVRQLAFDALGDSGNPQAVVPLVQGLRDPDETVRAAAASALGKQRDPRAVNALLEYLKDADDVGFVAAAFTLAKLREKRAYELIVRRMQEGDLQTRIYAAEALGELRDPRAAGPLLELYRIAKTRGSLAVADSEDESACRARLRAGAIIGLGALGARGGPEASKAVQEALADPNKWVRECAERAAGQLFSPVPNPLD